MKLLVADKMDDVAIEKMRKAGIDVVEKTGLPPETLLTEIPAYDAIAVRSNTKVTAKVIDAALRLKLIVRAGVGLDNIDVQAAAKRGIEVKNTPAATAISVAEHTIGLILSLTRHIPEAHAKLTNGIWDKKSFEGSELFGKTIGIVGFGKIGREVAARARVFGMEVIAHDPLIPKNIAAELQTPLLPLNDLLARSDYVTLHLPFTDETKNLISASRIAMMKRGSHLVNCARGGIVDEAAIAKAVREGHLGGAAFDVFGQEPLTSSPLMGVPGIILTPHLGASTTEGQRRAGLELAEIAISFFKQHR